MPRRSLFSAKAKKQAEWVFDECQNKFAQKHNLFQINITFAAQKRKDARVIEWTGLEIRRTAMLYRGFESHSFRRYRLRESLRFPFFVPFVSQIQDTVYKERTSYRRSSISATHTGIDFIVMKGAILR